MFVPGSVVLVPGSVVLVPGSDVSLLGSVVTVPELDGSVDDEGVLG